MADDQGAFGRIDSLEPLLASGDLLARYEPEVPALHLEAAAIERAENHFATTVIAL